MPHVLPLPLLHILPSIRINRTGETIPSRYWHWEAENMPDYDLIVLQRGKAEYSDGHTSWQVSPGSCMFFRPGGSYRGVQDVDNPVAMIFIHFDLLDEKKRLIFPPEADLLPTHFRIERPDFVTALARSVVQATQNPFGENLNSPPSRHCQAGEGNAPHMQTARLWLRALWVELQRQLHQPRWQGTEREQAQRIQIVCSKIRSRIGEPWRLKDIAAMLHCGTEHAGRLFRKYKGVSPGEFVIRTRIEAAQALLGSSSQSITEIAETLGFCDIYAFSRQFRQRTGLSPREFRA